MSDIGHNKPPSHIEFAAELAATLSEWLRLNPLVQEEDMARDGKVLHDRTVILLKEIEDERDKQVRPLNEQVKSINERYRGPRNVLEKILGELRERLDGYRRQEEKRREAIAEAARQAAEKARIDAIGAEKTESEAREDASLGVETDIGAAVAAADDAFASYRRMERAANRAERDSRVRLGGGFGPALVARSKETLSVKNPIAAVKQIGWTEKLLEALLSEARAYRKEYGKLPEGIESTKERSI